MFYEAIIHHEAEPGVDYWGWPKLQHILLCIKRNFLILPSRKGDFYSAEITRVEEETASWLEDLDIEMLYWSPEQIIKYYKDGLGYPMDTLKKFSDEKSFASWHLSFDIKITEGIYERKEYDYDSLRELIDDAIERADKLGERDNQIVKFIITRNN